MILTVTLNTAIDKTLAVPNFRLGRRHRTVDQTTMPGGKGVNVARVLKTLGAPVIATGLAGGATGTRIMATLLNELERTGGRYGLQTMCEGGGQANVTIIERL